ncbi:flavodoxin domain-containing protein [Candidatus Gottesmanbacteria bacterium]|nr:flavodoxin domain-containing protein [Candidatus Gottesmanbacteria bacterium]
MDILIVYATNSGGTLLASQEITSVFQKYGYSTTLKNVSEVSFDELSSADLVVFGSPSWDYHGKQGQVQEQYLGFMEKMKGKTFPKKKFAVFGLGDTSYTYFCGSVDNLVNFVKDLGGVLVGDPLRIDGFYFDQEKNTQIIRTWAEKIATSIAPTTPSESS